LIQKRPLVSESFIDKDAAEAITNTNKLGFLFLEPAACKQLNQHIGWQSPKPANQIEQGGLLIGKVFQKESDKVYWAVVNSIVPSIGARGTPASLEIDHNDWKEMLDRFDEHGDEYIVIGWYHTHPNNLDIFMSEVDRVTQQSMFCEDWHFAVVLNPQLHRWGVYRGAEAIPCSGYFLNRPILG